MQYRWIILITMSNGFYARERIEPHDIPLKCIFWLGFIRLVRVKKDESALPWNESIPAPV
jgi:hypothetical protein